MKRWHVFIVALGAEVEQQVGIAGGCWLQLLLARVVVGCLMTPLLITLVLVPTLSTLFEEGIGGLWKRSNRTEAVEA